LTIRPTKEDGLEIRPTKRDGVSIRPTKECRGAERSPAEAMLLAASTDLHGQRTPGIGRVIAKQRARACPERSFQKGCERLVIATNPW
jgi:hypothetical protein